MKKQINIWIEAIRLRTLPVSASGVIIGAGLAFWMNRFSWIPAVVCLVFAIMAQIVSNLANEYYDFLKGTDKAGRVGPRRGVTEGDIAPEALRRVMIVVLALTMLVGCALIPYGGWKLVLVGAFIAIGALAYSTGPYPLSYHGLGELAVFIFYGIIPVNFTFYVVAGHFSVVAFLASLTIGFMGVNVLLVNNYRDEPDDRQAGKLTSVVIFGRKPAAAAYLINGYVAVALLSPLWLTMAVTGKWWVLIAPLVYLGMHTHVWWQLTRRDGAELNPLLGATARNMLIFTFLLIVTLLV